ncbi:MAG: glutathione S-transferase family protein [Maricaulaceae bacterium]|nr:glutathione S-transferase family protein [Maricaulaceae bacterium]
MAAKPKPDLVLFHVPRTRSLRVRWALEETGLPYRLERPEFTRGDVGGAAYKAVNPLQKIPALTDGGGEAVCESIAAIQYLLGRYGPFDIEVKPDEADYGRYLHFLHYGEAASALPVSMLLAHVALLPEEHRIPAMAKWARYETAKALKYLDEHGLAGRDWLAGGRFTAADISVVYMLLLLKLIGEFGAAPDGVKAYFERATAREAWKRASAD